MVTDADIPGHADRLAGTNTYQGDIRALYLGAPGGGIAQVEVILVTVA